MIGDEKKSGIDPVVIFLLISLLIHGLLFYFIPKLHINLPKPKKKREKPISVQLINEPVKGEKKTPKKATALGKENITVKKETRPKNKPKVSGEQKVVKSRPLPPPKHPPKPKVEAKKPGIKVAPIPQKSPAPPKKEAKVKLKPKPKAEKKAKPVSKVKKSEKAKPKEKVLATPKKAPVKIAKTVPKPRILPRKREEKGKREKKKPSPKSTPAPGTAPRTQAPPAPESLFPSAETLHQIERKFSHTYPKDVAKGDVISLNTKEFKYISYFTHIKRKIELVWEYPRAAAEMGQEGSLLLRFTILKDGRLGGVKLLRSSGYRLLDREAIRAVKAAAPFNPIPDRLHKHRLNIIATFNYSLGFKFVY